MSRIIFLVFNMFKKTATLALIPAALTLLTLQSVPASAEIEMDTEQKQALVMQASAKIKLFAVDLKKTLKQGMKSQGPSEAINLCNIQAPAIASAHSDSAWTISRISLKVRNPDNIASDWQTDILQSFEKRKAAGEPVNQIKTSLVRDGSFYLVKAIPTAPLCITCHGSDLNPKVQSRLAELYPNDQATGFNTGDIRGAFIVSKKIGTK